MPWNTQEAVKRIRDTFSFVKDVSNIARDVLLLLLFGFLIFLPQRLNAILARAGVTQINGGFFSLKTQVEDSASQSRVAAQASSAAADSLSDVKATLTAISAQSSDPKVKSQAAGALNKINGSITSLQTADQSLTKSLVTQSAILQTVVQQGGSGSTAAAATPKQGWVYLGEADAQQERWMTPPQPKIASGQPPQKGQTVTLTDDLYLRADKQPGQTYNQAAITGAVRSGAQAQILDLQPSHALNGGVFLWAKISVVGN